MSDPTRPMPAGPPPGPPPTGPPGSPPQGPSGSGGGGPSGLTITLVVLLVLAVIGGGLAVFLVAGSDDDGGEEATAEEFVLEPISFSGENPFMDSVGTDEEDVEPPEEVGGSFEGGTEGLYGGTLDKASCDAEQLVAFLEANPAEAQAWADVQGIEVGAIADYVDGLTPMVLRSDTAVTNHGFTDGAANPIPAVLQAGTAVMVDEFGVPRVKCYCGNPLLPPPTPTTTTVYTGPSWPGYQETNVTVIQQTTVEIDVFTVIDVETNEPFGRPAGTDGTEDGPPPGEEPPGPTTTTTDESDFDLVGTYEGTLSATCGSAPITAVAEGDTITISGSGDTASGPLAPDGSFTVSVEGSTLSGVVAEDRVTGDFDFAGCTGTFDLPRTG